MKRKRFSEEQIIGVLMESEARGKKDDTCRHHGAGSATFYASTKKYDGDTSKLVGRITKIIQLLGRTKRQLTKALFGIAANCTNR